MELFDQLLKLQQQTVNIRKTYFFQHVLFSGQWWFLVLLTIVLWIAWAFLVNKKQLKDIIMSGLFTLAFAIILDDTGLSLALWNYPYKVFYFATRLDPVDLAILPVAYMFIYQYGQKWIHYLILTVSFALFAAFIAEPLFVQLKIYTLIHWKHIYSAPIYTGIGIIVKAAVDLIAWIEQRARRKYDHPK